MDKKQRIHICKPETCQGIHLLERVFNSIPVQVPNGLGGVEAGFYQNQLYADIKEFLDATKEVSCPLRDIDGHPNCGLGICNFESRNCTEARKREFGLA